MQVSKNTLIITHIIAVVISAIITFAVLEWRDKNEAIPVDPLTYIIQERIRIDREQIKPLLDSLEAIQFERDSLLTAKQRIRTIYLNKQHENLNLPDSVAYMLLLNRIEPILLPNR
jgi:hypothetical protein